MIQEKKLVTGDFSPHAKSQSRDGEVRSYERRQEI